MARTPDCHPDRKHHSKGLCQPCYLADWHRLNPGRSQRYSTVYRARRPDADRLYYLANRERVIERERLRRANDPSINRRRTAAKYGLTVEERDALLAHPCAICGRVATHVDHDHATGEVRGPLCGGCNTGIGLLGDDPERLAAAAEYLAARKPLLRIV